MKTKSNTMAMLAASVLMLGVPQLNAQSASQEAPAHNELRGLRDGLLDAINKGDLEATLKFMHPNVVITWHNAEVSRGHDGVRDYFNRFMTGPTKIIDKLTLSLAMDELTILNPGDTGISFGRTDEHYKLAAGTNLDVKGRWTATLLKEDGKWLITSVHVSTNLFDNAVLILARKTGIYAAIGALVAGIIAGWFAGRRRKQRA